MLSGIVWSRLLSTFTRVNSLMNLTNLTKLKVSILFNTYMNGRQPYHNNLYESKALLAI